MNSPERGLAGNVPTVTLLEWRAKCKSAISWLHWTTFELSRYDAMGYDEGNLSTMCPNTYACRQLNMVTRATAGRALGQ